MGMGSRRRTDDSAGSDFEALQTSLVERLDRIQNTIETLLIVECARGGASLAETRNIAKLGNNRVSSVWRHFKGGPKEGRTGD